MDKEEHREYHRRLFFIFLLLLSILLTGALVYRYLEGWRFIDSLYFSAATMTTVGYGDFTPKTDMGKLFSVFYFFTSIGMAIYGMSVFASHFIEVREEHFMEQVISTGKHTEKVRETINNMLSGGRGVKK